jgi:aryl-alcohol dehydrogenase-like predicted oxidoreductase
LAVPAGKPAVHAGRLAVYADRSAVHAGTLAVYAGKPAVHAGRPAVYAGKPAVHAGKPAVHAGKPAVHAGKPAVPGDRPAVHGDRPAVHAGKPAVHAGKPAVPGDRPAVHAGKPAVPGDRPAVPGDRPAVHAGRPAVHAGRPAVHAGKPAVHAGKPAVPGDRPAVHADKPAVHAGRPAVHAGRPAVHADKPAVHAGKPAVDADRPAVHADRPAVHAGCAGPGAAPIGVAYRPPACSPPGAGGMTMEQRRLGPDGPMVSAIGLGGMYLSITGRPDEAAAVRTVHAALDAGVTLIDTADVYCLDDGEIGHNERLFRRALAGRGEQVRVATKGGLRRPGGAWTRDGRPEHLAAACEASLKALGVAQIDLYQLHAPDAAVPFADSVGVLARLREQGKIRLVGLSNVSAAELAEARRLVPIASVQNRWNPGHRAPEHDGVLAACTEAGIAFLPYSPFGGASGAQALGERKKLAAEAARRGVSPHRLVLAWMLAKSPVVLPIPGARRVESVRDSAAAAGLALTAADVSAIEATFRG